VILDLFLGVVSGSNALTRVMVFIHAVGYGISFVHFVATKLLEKRLFSFTRRQATTDGFDLNRTADECLYFRSFSFSIELIKALHLAMLWFGAVFCVTYAYLCYVVTGWYCWLLYVDACLPFALLFRRHPWSTKLIVICQALSTTIDDHAVEGLMAAAGSTPNDDEEYDVSGVDSEVEWIRKNVIAGQTQRNRRRQPADLFREDCITLDDEPVTELTLHETLPADLVPRAEPLAVVGVPPTRALEEKWKLRPPKPVFS
jgi:hypothetical protein